MKIPSPEDIQAQLLVHSKIVSPALPGRRNHLKAGVLVPLRWTNSIHCILTLRSAHLNKHSNEVSFPGGKPDVDDQDLTETALREAREELGIQSPRVLGHLSDMPVYTSDFRLFPTVADIQDQSLVANPNEVAKIVQVDLLETMAQGQLHGLSFEIQGKTRLSPVFEVDDLVIFGATAYSLYEMLMVLSPLLSLPAPKMVPGKYNWRTITDINVR